MKKNNMILKEMRILSDKMNHQRFYSQKLFSSRVLYDHFAIAKFIVSFFINPLLYSFDHMMPNVAI